MFSKERNRKIGILTTLHYTTATVKQFNFCFLKEQKHLWVMENITLLIPISLLNHLKLLSNVNLYMLLKIFLHYFRNIRNSPNSLLKFILNFALNVEQNLKIHNLHKLRLYCLLVCSVETS